MLPHDQLPAAFPLPAAGFQVQVAAIAWGGQGPEQREQDILRVGLECPPPNLAGCVRGETLRAMMRHRSGCFVVIQTRQTGGVLPRRTDPAKTIFYRNARSVPL